MLATTQLKEIVRSMRKCKSISEERTIVARESFEVRNAFNGNDQQAKCVAITKLLYFHILGYSGDIGKVECLKLVASARFIDKRIGYLGCMMLLDETDEIHVMITNCLKNDLASQCNYIKSLALCTLASMCTPDIGKMIVSYVEPMINSTIPYLRRKAALCACRLVTKVPMLSELFIPHIHGLIDESQPDTRMSGISLAVAILEADPSTLPQIRSTKIAGTLMKCLRSLSSSDFPTEYIIHKVSNPFLQVKILRMLALLGQNDADISHYITETIAKILTKTYRRSSASNAILYEAVLTTFSIEANNDLLLMAMTVLRMFLDSNNANSRYVSLALLLKITAKHDLNKLCNRDDIFALIHDKELGIKKRAIELIFATINKDNVQSTVEHLTQYLFTVNDSHLKRYLTSNLVNNIEKYEFDQKWYFNIFIDLLQTSSHYIRDSSISNFISVISNSYNNHAAIHRIFTIIQSYPNQTILNNIGGWIIGEFGHTIIPEYPEITPHHLITCLSNVLRNTHSSIETKNIFTYAIMKLSSRLNLDSDTITDTIRLLSNHTNIELQQRASEWNTFTTHHLQIRAVVFDIMPPLNPPQVMKEPQPLLEMTNNKIPTKHTSDVSQDLLLQLNDIFGINSSNTSQQESRLEIMMKKPKSTFKYHLNVYNNNQLKMDLQFNDPDPITSCILIDIIAINLSDSEIKDIEIQIAVPKSMSSTISPPSHTTLQPFNTDNINQQLYLCNPTHGPITILIKLSYFVNNDTISEVVKITNFPHFTYLNDVSTNKT